MCLDEKCKWITMVEDDKTGEKCIIHYKFKEDGTFEELFTEGDLSLKIYVDTMRDNKYFHPSDYPRQEPPHFNINGTFEIQGQTYSPTYYPTLPTTIFNYPNQIATEIAMPTNIVMDFAGNVFDVNELSNTNFNFLNSDVDTDDEISAVDLTDIEDITDYDNFTPRPSN